MQREGVFREMKRRKAYEKSPEGGDLQPVVYVVAVDDLAKVVKIVGVEVQGFR
jgi:hypothetical protein